MALENKTNKIIVGYHGTNADNEKNILANNFTKSIGDEHWLGDGVYFFIDDENYEPLKNAINWAISNAWNNEKRDYAYKSYIVLSVNIQLDKNLLLDLDSILGRDIFNKAKNKLENTIYKEPNQNNLYDGTIINYILKKTGLKFIKLKVYIKDKKDRIYQKYSHINNCCILNVCDKTDIIKNSITIVKKGKI